MSDEKELVKEFNKVPPLESADSEILWNLLVQFCLCLGLLFLYIFIRPRVKWLYSPNIQGKRSHPCFGYDGYLSWIVPVITVKDTTLLILIGLDAFMMLQTLKFIFKIFFILCITVLPVIGYVYWNYFLFIDIAKNQYITRMSIGTYSNYKTFYYLILFYVYLISIFIFYFIYIYYKRYTVLRQLYLRNPSILTSIITLKKLSKQFSSAEKAAEYLSLSNRTLLVSNLPDFINTDNDLANFFQEMKLGNIEEAILIHDTTHLRKLYEEKNEMIENIEKEINSIVIKMNKWSIEHKEDCSESFENFEESLQNTVDSIFLDEYVDPDRKKQILKIFIKSDDKFRTMYHDNVKALDFFFDKLKVILEKIYEEKNKLNQIEDKKDASNILELTEEQNALFIPGYIDKDASFFPLSHFFNIDKYGVYFSLDIPIGAKKGFVVFEDYKDASIVKQAKIGSKIFSVDAKTAPTPNDIIWQNINKSGFISFVFKSCGDIGFIIFNIIFAYLAVQTIEMVRIDRFQQNGYIYKFFKNHPAIKDLYTGIVPALVYNILLVIVPIIIITSVNLEGLYSYSTAQKSTMSRYSNFLFFNAFLSVFFASTIYSILMDLLSGKLTLNDFTTQLGKNILSSVTLFVNTAIQKSLFGLAMLLLKPGPLIVNHFISKLFTYKTRRQFEQSEYAPPFDFGTMFPELLIVFPMLFSYTLIFPFVLILGLFYFGLLYLFYKNEFLYSSRNHYESGGKFWEQAIVLVIYSILSFQLATAAVLFFHGEKMISLLILPICYVTFNFETNLNTLFSKSCNSFPLNHQESEYLDEFTDKLQLDRLNLLETWEEETPTRDLDNISLENMGFKDDQEVMTASSYYKDPATSSSMTELILPRNFFKLLIELKKFDKGNLFGYKKSAI
ncbi:calcium permeable stress-gated cation channel 1 [Vairimorpha necatrix]|uniref:Calcium permeable stress-gated cation channel 1 n=1 Tax=Vairimorpha necatrix TaxID=6039 RepID=A0AAX4JB02_9MICR